MRHALQALVVVITLALTVASARAEEINPHLEQANRALGELRYSEAQTNLAQAIAWGRNSPRQLAEIYRLTGELEATLGDRAGAAEAFQRWIAIDPDAALPAGTSPKLTEPFATARAFFAGREPLRVAQRIELDPPAAVVEIEADPLDMVSGARIDYLVAGGRWLVTEARGRGVLRISLPRAELVSVVIAVIDGRGNALVAYGTRDQPLVVDTLGRAAGAVTGEVDRGGRPFFARWPVWAGTALALGAATTYFALDTRRAQRDLDAIYAGSDTTEFDDVADRIDQLERRGARSALITNVGLALTSAAAVTSVILAITGRDSGVTIAPASGGAQVGYTGRF